jgi:hypothetical protein
VQKIIDRVAKLLALAGNNANENEALAALEKAHALLAEHNLTMAEIGAVGQAGPSEDEVRDSLETDTNMPERYNRWIWNAVAKANACLCFSCRPNPKKYQTKYTLVGRKINTVVATQMALYLCQTMKRLASEHCRQAGRTDHAYKNAYLVGMAARLCERVADMQAKAAAAATGNALVLWSANEERENRAHVEEAMGIKLRSKKVAKVRYNTEAMGAGKSDAERVSLSQQVGGAKKAQQAIAAA